MDESTNWYSAFAVGAQIHFKMPSWPFALYPSPLNKKSDLYWKAFMAKVPKAVGRSMIHAHSIFEDDAEALGTATTEARKWKTVILDFSRVKGVGSISSHSVFADAGEKDILDYDYIEIPKFAGDAPDGNDIYLGFKVGVIPPEGEGARKVNRTGPAKSKLAQKKEEAAKKKNGTEGTGTTANGDDDDNMSDA